MPLPQQVINQLSRESVQTPGWSVGLLTFTGGLLILALAIYLGMIFVYEPHLQNQLNDLENQAIGLVQSVSPQDQAQLVGFYSQVSNLQTLLRNHVTLSQLFSWIENNTETNVTYTQLSFSGTNGITISLSGIAKTMADLSQQVAIFEASPNVKSIAISNVSPSTQNVGYYQFTANISLVRSLITSPFSTAASSTASASPNSTTTP